MSSFFEEGWCGTKCFCLSLNKSKLCRSESAGSRIPLYLFKKCIWRKRSPLPCVRIPYFHWTNEKLLIWTIHRGHVRNGRLLLPHRVQACKFLSKTQWLVLLRSLSGQISAKIYTFSLLFHYHLFHYHLFYYQLFFTTISISYYMILINNPHIFRYSEGFLPRILTIG